jgi:hypothetical protein
MDTIIQEDKELSVIKTQISKAISTAKTLEIATPEDMPSAVDLLSKIKTVGKLITAKKEAITKPLNESLKQIRAFFAPFEEEYEKAERIVKVKMIDFDNRMHLEAIKKQAVIEKKVSSGKMTMEKAADKLEDIIPKKSVATSEGAVSFKVIKEVIIVDESKLPREYMIPDLAKIKKVALAGIAIAGVEVQEKKIVAGTTY